MSEAYQMLDLSGERFLPGFHGKNIEIEHLHRYIQACDVTEGQIVLDIASGEGYGSAMLANKASKVIGVDISSAAVQHARRRYSIPNLEYMVGSCADIPLPDSSVDVVVSFETIEHHDQHEEMMQEIKRVLRPSGFLLISSPDKYNYSVETGYKNEFHVKELYEHEFQKLLSSYFKKTKFFGQKIIYGSGIFPVSGLSSTLSHRQENKVVNQTVGLVKPVYWIALASDVQLPRLSSGIFEQRIEDSEHVQYWLRVVSERDGQIAGLNQAMAERDGQIAGLNQAIAKRDGQIVSLNQAIAERDAQIVSLNQAVSDRDGKITILNQTASDREFQMASLSHAVSERDGQIVQISWNNKEAYLKIQTLDEKLAEADRQADLLKKELTGIYAKTNELNALVLTRDEDIAGFKRTMTSRNDTIVELWKLLKY